MKTYDVIIVGGGPAGLTAAIYTSRRNLSTLILTKSLGGQAAIAPYVENYPGFKSISGIELMKRFEEQVKVLGVEIAYEEVVGIEKRKNFIITTTSNKYESRALILAFGKTPRTLGVPGEQRLQGKGVSYCAVCDGPLFADKEVVVIGGGNSAVEAALFLSEIARRVYLVHRRREFRAFEASVEKLKSKTNVELILDSIVTEFKGDNFLQAVVVENVKSKEKRELEVQGAFVEIGSEVKSGMIKDFVKLDENGHIVITRNCETFQPNTNKIMPGVFAAGDITDVPFKQVVVSAGEGAKAGLQVYNYLRGITSHKIVADWGKTLNEKDEE